MITPVLVCGGVGTRLWPLSRESYPKQFIRLTGEHSFFQSAVLRVRDETLFAKPLIVAHEDYRFLIEDQLAEIGVEASLLLEPVRRNSGPAIAAAAAFAAQSNPSCVLLAMPADHRIMNFEAFRWTCAKSEPLAEAGYLVTFGIRPSLPVTAYGYIVPDDNALPQGGQAIRAFVEKPDAAQAEQLIGQGALWNAGLFLFQAQALLADYARQDQASVEAIEGAVTQGKGSSDCFILDCDAFAQAKPLSLDYAVMEGTTKGAVVEATFDWADIGSWDAVGTLLTRDEHGNTLADNSCVVDSTRTIVFSDQAFVAVAGMDDVVVASVGDCVLVAHRDRPQAIRAVVEQLQASKRPEMREHLKAFRPWGLYQKVDRGARHQVKRIIVKPGRRLSLQRHAHRAEHWIVVQGTARVTICGEVSILHENQSTYVPIGAEHRLENIGSSDLELIEVQTGSYLGEDDIERLEDDYSRV